MSIRIIGLYGTKCSGKDTFFRALKRADYRCLRFAFADLLKGELALFIQERFGYDPTRLTPEQKEIVRHLWIGHGMARRAVDPEYWVKAADREIYANVQRYGPTGVVHIGTDYRFPNEADWFRRYPDFRLIGLRREGTPLPTDEEAKHATEMEKRVDIWVDLPNVTNEQDLQPVARQLLGQLNLL